MHKDDYVYVYVGRIVKDKGINELISSFNLINKKVKNVKLVLVGSFEKHLDPLKPHVEQIIETNENIITTGFQKDVRPYFAIADIFTFPTYREGFPNVLMQSCAMGIPSITTNINGCNEIITNNINGFIIEPQNEEQLKEKMLYVYENSHIIKKFKLNCRAHIVANYERKYIWSEIGKEYKQLIN
ncbi:glycosyltransferase [Tenacibaculum aquimarinum]|uniref:glycosyltransferase n=1 Tax=Tenacibaculum aquimarinum TaxID=2910675 RepID=UPI0035A968DE